MRSKFFLGCPSDWSHFKSYCYFVSKKSQPWKAAQDFCEQQKGELVQITSFEENEYVLNLVKKREPYLQEVWIGLRYNQKGNKFLWSDNVVPYFKYWPNSIQERQGASSKPCVYMFTSRKYEPSKPPGSWNDVNCESYKSFVCKKLQ